MAKNSKKSNSKERSGVLKVICPVCGYTFRYKRGRKKNPKLKEVDKWLDKARCPKCGQKIRIKDPKNLTQGKQISRI